MKTSRVIELALLALSSTAPLVTASLGIFDSTTEFLGSLVERDSNVCGIGATNYTSCGQGLPANFCCGPETTCNIFNNNASVICCPAGKSCNTIKPIPCSINFLNATAFPTNPLHTTGLAGNLPSCGTNTCCPAGYDCNNNECTVHGSASSSSAPSSAPSSASSITSSTPSSTGSSASSSASSSVSATATPLGGATGNSTIPATCNKSCDKFPVSAVLAGFFPGIIAGILLTIGTIVCVGRKKRSSDSASDDLGDVRAKISDPIYHENNSIRTDFMSKVNRLTRSPRGETFSSPKSPRTYELASPFQGARNVKTPEATRRPPSTESITIYSPPDTRGAARQTTFTEMLQNAGFKHNDTFLGSPGKVDPRVRDLTGSIR